MNIDQLSRLIGRARVVAPSLMLISLLFLNTPASQGALPPPDGEAPGAANTPSEARFVSFGFAQDKAELRNPKLDSYLAEVATSAQTSEAEALDLAESRSLTLSDGRVHVQVVTHAAGLEVALRAVTQAGGEVTGVGYGDTLIQGWLPVKTLAAVAAQDEVLFVRRPVKVFPLENLYVGNSTTEGLAVINGLAWHAAGYTGSGVKVGVIDAGFTGYPGLLGSDLPALVTVRNFVDGEGDAQVDGTTEHGAACAEVICDVAPAVEIYLAKVATDLDLVEAADWLISQEVDIISTSIGLYNATPGDGTGYLADLVNRARAAGILWVTAAGNDRESHWGGVYRDTDGDGFHEFAGGEEVNCFTFDGVTCPAFFLGDVNIFVRWSDWDNVDQDYDVHLVRWDGARWVTVASSTDVQNGRPGQTPTEWIAAGLVFDLASYGLRIERMRGSRPVNFEVFTPGLIMFGFRPLERLQARSITNLGDSPGAVTVAALDVTNLTQEFYSSEGPTNGPGGAETGGFIKPDISGFANVSTQSYGPGVFNGTSAATPHVAGAAALALSAFPGYGPDQLQSFLETLAVDMGDAGTDVQFGYGRLYLGEPLGAAPSRRYYLPLIFGE